MELWKGNMKNIKTEWNKHKEILYLITPLLLFPICDVIQVFAMFNMTVF